MTTGTECLERCHETRHVMRIRLTLKPGKRGTRRLVQTYGDRLVCVRYRYDEVSGMRHKTVELIISSRRWSPKRRETELVAVRIARGERVLQMRLRHAGGRWDSDRRVWWLEWGGVQALELADRVDPAVR
jgi:hypothetical protein